jgi:hypothetical protein
LLPSFAPGVGQLVSIVATSFRGRFIVSSEARPSRQSRAAGVGHEVEPLADVRGASARSAQIRRPEGVTLSFQVS